MQDASGTFAVCNGNGEFLQVYPCSPDSHVVDSFQYVGEGIKVMFSLTRWLSSCAVLIYRIDSLFGARILSCSLYPRWAVFVPPSRPEDDGDQGIEPSFDLDDAVLRRLPSLAPSERERGREGIYKILLQCKNAAEDVNFDGMAARMRYFSGFNLKRTSPSHLEVRTQLTRPFLR